MIDTKISCLILNLKNEEVGVIKKYLLTNNQKIFYTILNSILLLKTKTLTREEIYLRVYKKKITKKNDVIFRNHLSDLADLIEELLIKDKLPIQYETNIQFQIQQKLDFYFHLNLEKEYETILKKAKNYALQHYEFSFYSKLLEQYILLTRKNIQLLNISAQKLYAIIDEATQFNLMQADLDIGKLQSSKGFAVYCDFQSGILKKIEKSEIEKFDKNIKNATTDIGKFWCTHGICYLLFQTDIDALHYFEDLIKQARNIYTNNPYFKETLIISLQLMATKFSLIGAFEKANTYFEEIFSLINNDKNPQVCILYLNYTTNLIKLKKYAYALEKIYYIEKNIKMHGQHHEIHLAMRKIMCYTFLEKADLLHEVIVEKDYASLSATHRIYFRLSLCNAYIMEKNYEMADMEIKNLLRSKLMNEADTDHLPNAELMQYLIAQVYKNNNLKLTQKQIVKFKELRDQLDTERHPQLQHYTPYLWLVEKLNI